jgi:hypothetical protein
VRRRAQRKDSSQWYVKQLEDFCFVVSEIYT